MKTTKLIGILVALLLVYLGIQFFGGKERSKNYREKLVEIDTAKVDKVLIEKTGEKLELVKLDGDWNVKIAAEKYAKAQPASVNNTLHALLDIRSSRIVTKNREKWKEYQVDTSGTRVQVYENDKKSLDIILGRFGFQNQRQYSTYVRLADDDEVYAADQFMPMSISTEVSRYRNSQVTRIPKDSVSTVEFSFPDSAFTLAKAGGHWTIEGFTTDSSATAKFLSSLSRLDHSVFYDQDIPQEREQLSITVSQVSGSPVTLRAWNIPGHGWVVHSSHNPESYFTGEELFEKLAKPKGYFTGEAD